MLAKPSNDIHGNVSPSRLSLPGLTKKIWAELSSSPSSLTSSSLYKVKSATRSSISLGRTKKASLRTFVMKGRRKVAGKQSAELLSENQDDVSMSDSESVSSIPSDSEMQEDHDMEERVVSKPSTEPQVASNIPTTLSPRPFPPESLAEVPVEFVCQQMRELAPDYWQDEETADCTLVVPIPYMDEEGRILDLSANVPGTSGKVFGVAGRRFTEPNMSNVQPKLTFELHRDYLSAHSMHLRTLFSGAHPIDLVTASANPCAIPSDRRPRLLPSSPDHPILLLPVPDPSSIHLLFEYIYFGEIAPVQAALEHGHVQWEGVARNAEYLGLELELKLFLKAYWDHWNNPDRKDESDSDSEVSDDDEDEFCSDTEGSECTMEDPDDDCSLESMKDGRGRSTEVRPIASHSG